MEVVASNTSAQRRGNLAILPDYASDKLKRECVEAKLVKLNY